MHTILSQLRVLLLLLAAVLASCGPDSGATTARSSGPGLVFENADAKRPYFHDFGDRLWGERIEHTYRLVNREGRTIVLQDLLPDCGCTQPRATVVMTDGSRVDGGIETRSMGLEVPNGATLEVRIGLDTTRVERPNQHKLAQVRLRCDSDVTPYLTFELHVLVKRAFRAAPTEAVLKDVPQSAGKSVRIDVSTENANDGSKIRGIEVVEGPFHAELTETEVGSENLWVLVVSADPGSNLGPHSGKVVLGTTNDDGTGVGQNFEVHVRAVVVEDCVIDPRVLAITREKDAVMTANVIALVPGAVVGVKRVRFEGGASSVLRAEPQPDAPDTDGRASKWRLVIRAEGELPGEAFSGRMVVELDDPALPFIEVPYAAPPR